MTKGRKVELLYQKANGQGWNASPEEKKELSRYKVDAGESSFIATKSNLSEYVTAVDKGYRLSFYDWCMENRKADRRRKNSDEESMARFNSDQNKAVVFIGWLTWGIAIYWIMQGTIPVAGCAVIGAAISFVLFKIGRKQAVLTLIGLPVILAIIFATKRG